MIKPPSFKQLKNLHFVSRYQYPIGHRFQKALLLFTFFVLSVFITSAQELTISSSSTTASYSTSGTNPVTITINGGGNLARSVITNYLNNGTSVIVNHNHVITTIENDISKTAGGDASLTFKDQGMVRMYNGSTISSTSGKLDIILWSDSDVDQSGTVDDYIFLSGGTTLQSNGGKIVLAGGADNGANGGVSGDGIPDGFAWNGAFNSVSGVCFGSLISGASLISLLSGGGDIIIRGRTSNSNGYAGITSRQNLLINSGEGTITMYGRSSVKNGLEFTYTGNHLLLLSLLLLPVLLPSIFMDIPALPLERTAVSIPMPPVEGIY